MNLIVVVVGIVLAILALKLVFGVIKFVLVGIIVLVVTGWLGRKLG